MIATNDLRGTRQAMEQIREIHKELIEGADFAEIAKEQSDDVSSANLGGDMGWFMPQAYGERMSQTLVAMQDGEISEPFQTEEGWHIIERLGMREKDVTVESIRSAARKNLEQQKMDIELEQFLQEMRDEAFVEIRLEG
jgi:peptidyl-prolyl cis-trans isomerase SurA